MGYEFNKTTGKIDETKPAIQSMSIWAGAGTVAIGILQVLPELVEQIGPLLPPHVLGIATAVAGVIVILRRVYAENPPIQGIIRDD